MVRSPPRLVATENAMASQLPSPRPACPACSGTSNLTELDTTAAGDHWLQCETCGHLWRHSQPGEDPFTLIISTRATTVLPCREARTRQGTPRAARYLVRLPLRYRLFGSLDWRMGQTENVSASGVLFRTQHSGRLFSREADVQRYQPVELLVELQTTRADATVRHVRCLGEVVRRNDPEASDMLPTIAVAVQSYHVATA